MMYEGVVFANDRKDTCSFPVDKKNWLVAASGMVSMQLELGIAAREEEILVPMVDEVSVPRWV